MSLDARPSAAVLLTALLGACMGGGANTLDSHMKAHLEQVGEIQAAIVEGVVPRVHAPAKWLAEHPQHPSVASSTGGPVADLRRLATHLQNETSLPRAAANAASMAAACGACHESMRVSPRVQVAAAAPGGADFEYHMGRHAWAAQRMWEGLMIPSAELWETGTQALAEAPLVLSGADEQSSELAAVEEDVHRIGADALRASTPTERADTYGLLLLTCSRCHDLFRGAVDS